MKTIRNQFSYSGAKLRRARRLYRYLCADFIIKNPVTSFPIAFRAMKAGLYSENSTINDVVFSFWRGAWKKRGGGLDWWQFCESLNVTYIWFEAKKYFTKTSSGYVQTGKPKLRLVASDVFQPEQDAA